MTNEIPKEHIRHCMLFEFRKGNSATVATKNICDVYPNALNDRTCQRWFSKFKSGNFDLSDSHRSGRPQILDNDVLKAEIEVNPYKTIKELSNTFGMPWSTIQEHLKHIGKKSKTGVWVPHSLQEQYKIDRFLICNLLLQRHHTESFFDNLITAGEKWITYYKSNRKRQLISSNESPQITEKLDYQLNKVFLSVWWSIHGIVHFEIQKCKPTVNVDLYCEQLDRVNESLIQKYSEIINMKKITLQHDNARQYSGKQTFEKINKLGWEILPYPPHSSDISPSDFHLFPTLQHFLNEKKFKNFYDVKYAISKYLNLKPIDFYRSGIENLQIRWQRVVNNEGDYIID
ncbi:PREDICTED: histone-lysine N-methyltransferase SETMAR-like [Polistes dominula]|uniref:Histone-lysine N-methyltransferase SETMAR-like n=1 Tax=Polistes dominula TaxID=743375 RepID=A0ABM1IWN8_POLDO|nr:PREDICTED: histone-lysine N-methyltransferase SETMAR-like [Polistes dominula]